MISKTLDIEGPVRIVDYGGEGPPILLLHGLAGSVENWEAVGGDLTSSGRVVAIDLLGCGETPPAGREVSLEHNAALVARVVDELGQGPASLVGHSMGGLVAMLTATEYHDRVERLVLVSPALPLAPGDLPDIEVFVKLLGPLVPFAGPLAVHLYRIGKSPQQEYAETMAMNCFDTDAVPGEVQGTMMDEAKRRRRQPWAVSALVDADRSVASYVLRPSRLRRLLHRVSQPTLLIHGAEDRLVSAGSVRWAANERPDWDFVSLEDVGHLPALEAPGRFVQIAQGWLGE